MSLSNVIRKTILASALLPTAVVASIAPSNAGVFVGVSVGFAPPPLPVYTQPPCPVAGYIWTPGYWGYASSGYYWVPGAWSQPPSVGVLWTPPYWGFAGGSYLFHAGYWGPSVGFYGGINYGFGYGGFGFTGGAWSGGVFSYNTAFSNVNVNVVHNTYVNNNPGGYNPGGPEQPGHYPGDPGQPGYNPGGPEQPGHYPGAPGQPGDNPGGPEQPGTNPGEPGQSGYNPGGPEQPGHNPGGPEQPGTNPGGPEQPGTNPGGPIQHGSNPTVPIAPSSGGYAGTGERPSYNGGPGGVSAQPNAAQLAAAQQEHTPPTAQQRSFYSQAENDRGQYASANGGRPETGALSTDRSGFGYGNEVNTREGNQQSRIAHGVNGGGITPGGERNLEDRENSINDEARTDRAENGGSLTPDERQEINQRQNNVSRSIYNDRHNGVNDSTAAYRHGTTPGQERQQAQTQRRQNRPRGPKQR